MRVHSSRPSWLYQSLQTYRPPSFYPEPWNFSIYQRLREDMMIVPCDVSPGRVTYVLMPLVTLY